MPSPVRQFLTLSFMCLALSACAIDVPFIAGGLINAGNSLTATDAHRSVLVCSPKGETVVDPASECHAE